MPLRVSSPLRRDIFPLGLGSLDRHELAARALVGLERRAFEPEPHLASALLAGHGPLPRRGALEQNENGRVNGGKRLKADVDEGRKTQETTMTIVRSQIFSVLACAFSAGIFVT